jgi:ParB family chromosome partitioning protein
MLIDINKIVVNDRIRHDYGDLEELAEDIRTNTLLNPPVVNTKNPDGTYTLIAGERRLRAMRDVLGYTQVDVNVVPAEDDEHALLMEISENECRKEFTKTERLDYARRLARIEAAKAKERQTSGVKNPEGGRAREKVAEALGVSDKTIRQEQFIENNRDLLDPSDFAEWDEGKLSTNKAFQRIKAAKAQAEEELRRATIAKANATTEAVSLKQQLDAERAKSAGYQSDYEDMEEERDQLKQQLSLARDEVAALEKQNDELYAQKNPEPKVVEREVVREVESEESKRRIAELEHTERIHSDDNQKLRRQIEELNKKLDRAKTLLKEKGHEDNASWDIAALTSATNQYLRSYGGKAWAFDQFYRVDEVTQKEFVKAITALAAFAQNMYQMVSDNNKLEGQR